MLDNIQLDYGLVPPQNRKRQYAIAGAICLVAILLFGGVRYVRQRIQERRYWQVVYQASFAAQQQDMAYTAPPQQVVYEEDPLSADKLLASGATGYIRVWRQRSVGFHYSGFRNWCWPFGLDDALVFLHERRTSNGASRIVAVGYLHAFGDQARWDRSFVFRVWQPGFGRGYPEVLHLGDECFIEPLSILHDKDLLRLYAGQADSTDLSHFTIRYEVNNQPGTIDGWLKDDDTIKLEVRDGPAK
jgi:hypothetical protein